MVGEGIRPGSTRRVDPGSTRISRSSGRQADPPCPSTIPQVPGSKMLSRAARAAYISQNQIASKVHSPEDSPSASNEVETPGHIEHDARTGKPILFISSDRFSHYSRIIHESRRIKESSEFLLSLSLGIQNKRDATGTCETNFTTNQQQVGNRSRKPVSR